MNAPFDIFRTEINGGVLWIESAATLEDAKARVQELGMRSPGEYLLLNQEKGDKLVIRLDGVNGSRAKEREERWMRSKQDGEQGSI